MATLLHEIIDLISPYCKDESLARCAASKVEAAMVPCPHRMEFNKQLIWLWTHCRAIGMGLSNAVEDRKGIGSKDMELDIALFTSTLATENAEMRQSIALLKDENATLKERHFV